MESHAVVLDDEVQRGDDDVGADRSPLWDRYRWVAVHHGQSGRCQLVFQAQLAR